MTDIKKKGPAAGDGKTLNTSIKRLNNIKNDGANQEFSELVGDARAAAVGLIEAAMAGAAGEGVTVTVSFEGAPKESATVDIEIDRCRRIELAICGWQPTLRMPAGDLWQIVNRLNNTDASVEDCALALQDPKEARQLLRSKDDRENLAEDLLFEFRQRMEMCEVLMDSATDPTQLVGSIPTSAAIFARSKGGAR